MDFKNVVYMAGFVLSYMYAYGMYNKLQYIRNFKVLHLHYDRNFNFKLNFWFWNIKLKAGRQICIEQKKYQNKYKTTFV